MKRQPAKLALGPLPQTELVKVTVSLSTETKQLLDRYAEVHSQVHGKSVDATILIPFMLETFMRRDRRFNTQRSIPSGA